MENDVVIRAAGLGKKYIIGHKAEAERYVTLRDVIARAARGAWRRTKDMSRGRAILGGDSTEEFWALKDVSFEVKRGEALGIIGRNGAGKSTMLKILSRITEPSEGRVTIKGRVASLLEVGTGFHPELTGRENIYLNGAVLGMTRAEIKKKFDEIVSFAEVEKFLDTPVKRYSSGMYVRLAFAVAAHLEPEILIVDEVLAVGDAEFQKKCLGRMGEVAGNGRTVIFVSHNNSAICSLCSRAILLSDGRLIADNTVARALELYFPNLVSSSSISEWRWSSTEMPGDETFRIQRVSIKTSLQNTTSEVSTEEALQITIEYEKRFPVRGVRVSLQLLTAAGEIAFTTTDHSERSFHTDEPGLGFSKCLIPAKLLNVGRYVIRVSVDIPGVKVIAFWFDVGSLNVVGSHNGGTTYTDSEWPGVVSPRLSWSVGSANRLAPALNTLGIS